MKKIILSFLVVAVMSSLVFMACSKDNAGDNSGNTTLKVRMTDKPFAAEEVNVDIQQVLVNFRKDSTKWISLNTNAGVYNLLNLQGVDTLLGVGIVPTDFLQEIRLVLGSNNSIKVAGVIYPLTIPSGSESGLKIKVNKKLNGTLDSLLIDFDAELSIHQDGVGDYKLKPVIKLK